MADDQLGIYVFIIWLMYIMSNIAPNWTRNVNLNDVINITKLNIGVLKATHV
jgi:hypothetical protein